MLLVDAHVTNFRSIDDSSVVPIDPEITVLVGQNESGKTAFLKALYKAVPVEGEAGFDVIEDFPRRRLSEYEAVHEKNPAVGLRLTYRLNEAEISKINEDLGVKLFSEITFSESFLYGGGGTIYISYSAEEKKYIEHVIAETDLPETVRSEIAKIKDIKTLIEKLGQLDLNEAGKALLGRLTATFADTPKNWPSYFTHYVWNQHLKPMRPKFLYFDDYMLLPGKVNLPSLYERVLQKSKKALSDEDNAVLALLRLAKIELSDLINPTGYEKSKARLEGISNSITDKIFKFWTQNKDLEVLFDIKDDPDDDGPFNNGNNLYIRIRNQRHRVSVPFDQRSKGFIWFFSFLVWFDSIKQHIGTADSLVLLLDEPGLSLHALAQNDFLRYIDELATKHQTIYTTHSPFMVHSDRLHQVRMVEDKIDEGTKVSSEVALSDKRTIFPLQAALGYSIAQNLFISEKNLLVEGPADLIYFKFFSSILEQKDDDYLSEEITIVPAGGLDKVATFVSLLGANQLELAVIHDFDKKPDARLEHLVREKILRDKQVLNFAMFRDGAKKNDASTWKNSDVEDMLSSSLYLKLFNGAYKKELSGLEIKETDLPPGDRIVDRLNRFLASKSIVLRVNGGFNHYRVANYLASNPFTPSKVDKKTTEAFSRIFAAVNKLF